MKYEITNKESIAKNKLLSDNENSLEEQNYIRNITLLCIIERPRNFLLNLMLYKFISLQLNFARMDFNLNYSYNKYDLCVTSKILASDRHLSVPRFIMRLREQLRICKKVYIKIL